jgi:hypothetical protein
MASEELFANIPQSFREECKGFMNFLTLLNNQPLKQALIVNNYRNSLDEYRRDYFDFYWNVWMEEHGIDGTSDLD